MTELRVGPHSVGDIIGASFTIYRRRFGPMVGIALLLVFVPFVVSVIGGCTADANLNFDTSCDSAVGWIGLALSVLGIPGVWAAASILAVGAYVGESSDRWLAVRSGISSIVLSCVALLAFNLFVLALAFLLVFVGAQAVIALFGFLLFFVGPFLLVSFVVFIPALAIERLGLFRSLGRSWRLVSGHRWRVFGVGLVMFIISFVVFVGLSVVVEVLLSALGGLDEGDVFYYSEGIIILPFVPLVGVVYAVIYVDLRARKENLDSAGLSLLLSGSR